MGPSLMRVRAVLFAASVGVMSGGVAMAQDAPREMGFNRYRIHTPASAIRDLAEDGEGFLFVATPAGLLRYDGRRFEFMSQLPEMRGNIVALAVDGQGALWAASVAPPGVIRLRRGEAQIMLPLGNSEVALGTTRTGGVLVVSDGVVTIMQGEKVVRTFRAPDETPMAAIAEDVDGVVWLGSARGLDRFVDGQWTRVPTPSAVTAIARDGSDPGARLLIGTREDGLLELAAGSMAVRTLPEGWQFNKEVRDLAPMGAGGVLVGIGDGVIALNSNTPAASSGVIEIDNRRLPDLRVTAVLRDREGNLFVGTESGALLHRLPAPRVRVMDAELGIKQAAFGLLAARDGTVYFLEGAGVLTAYRDGKVVHHAMPDAINSFNLRGLAEAADGSLFAGSLNGPLYRFRAGTWDAIGLAQGLPKLGVRALTPEADGGLWLSFEDGSIAHWDGRLFTAYSSGEVACRAPIAAINVAPDHALWLASGNDGLCRFDPIKRSARRIASAEGFTAHNVSSLHRQGDVLWITSHDAGLWREQAGRFVRALPRARFPGLQMGDLLDDGVGGLWLTSFEGLARVDRKAIDAFLAGRRASVPADRVGVADGLPSASFIFGWPNVAARDQRGHLWFATVAGVVRIDDPGAAVNPTPLRVQIDGLRLDGEDQLQIQRVPIEAPIGRGNLEVTYSTPALARPHRVRFEYRLRGWEEEFTDAGDRTTAIYTGLPPGRFTFEVRAVTQGQDVQRWADGDGVTRMPLRLVPPFSRTPAWRGLLAAIAVAMVALLLWLRRRQRAVRAQAVAEERARLGRELHDTLDQTFVAIDLQLQSASAKLEQAGDVKPHLDRAHALLDRGLTEARASIWALRADHPGEGGLAGRIAVILGEMTRGTPVRNELRVTGESPALPPDVERELSRIAGEAIANALRHARPGQLVINVDQGVGQLCLRIADDGCGFVVDAPAPNGDDRPRYGLRGMRERAARAGASVSWESRTGSGTTVLVRWPSRATQPVTTTAP